MGQNFKIGDKVIVTFFDGKHTAEGTVEHIRDKDKHVGVRIIETSPFDNKTISYLMYVYPEQVQCQK